MSKEFKPSEKNIIEVGAGSEPKGYRIAQRFDLRSDSIIEHQVVPLHNLEAFASIVSQYVDERESGDYVSIDFVPQSDGAIYVKGNSMYPLLWSGDVVLYKVTKSRRGGLFFGNIYVIAYLEDGEEHIVIKYLDESETPGYYTLRSHNPDYAPKEIPRDSVRILAMVKTSFRHYE